MVLGVSEFQRKYKYKVAFDLTDDDGAPIVVGFDSPDEVTLPERNQETIKRWNVKLNQEVQSQGKLTYGQLTVRGALQIVSGAERSAVSQAIAALQNIVNSNVDCLDVTVFMMDMTEERILHASMS